MIYNSCKITKCYYKITKIINEMKSMKLDKKKMQIAMARKKMSNAALARATGITPQTVGNMLQGCRETSLPTVGKVAEALDVDVTDIIAD